MALSHAVQIRPEETGALGKLGVCQVETGQLEAATATFDRLRALDPHALEVPYGMGFVAMASGDPERARREWEYVLAADPLNVPVRQALARLEEARGDSSAALRYCEEIGQIAPDTPGNDDCITRNRRATGG
jgi:Flp pilus assembly protein TadD